MHTTMPAVSSSDELGIDPSPALQQLYGSILRQEGTSRLAALRAERARTTTPTWSRHCSPGGS